MHRFYTTHLESAGHTATLTNKQEIHHLYTVLRLKIGDPITIFDGRGTEMEGKIASVKQDSIEITIEKKTFEDPKEVLVSIACAIPKKSKFEFIIEKCTELGADEIIPLKTQRTELKLSEDRLQNKFFRYHTVAINASKQSGRKIIPKIYPITPFQKALDGFTHKDIVAFIPCLLGQRKNLMDAFKELKIKPKKILFLIGPEGDFTQTEVDLAIKTGCLPVSLGPTVLKVDTAAISVVAATNLFFAL